METQAQKGLRNKLPLIVGCCAVVVVVVALGWVFLFRSPASKLELRELRISRTQNGPAAEEPVFIPREQIWLNAWVGNFARDGETAHVIEDLQLFDPSGKQIMNRAGIVEFRDTARADDEILLPVYVAIPDGFPIGQYKAKLMVKDKITGVSVEREALFSIQAKPPEGPTPAAAGQPAPKIEEKQTPEPAKETPKKK